jgi:hypothetical protein
VEADLLNTLYPEPVTAEKDEVVTFISKKKCLRQRCCVAHIRISPPSPAPISAKKISWSARLLSNEC